MASRSPRRTDSSHRGHHTVSNTNQRRLRDDHASGDCEANGTIRIVAGDDKTCTITNDDSGASLTVTKIVTNDNGGDAIVADFPLVASTPPA